MAGQKYSAFMRGKESYIAGPDGTVFTSTRVIMARLAGAATVESREEHLCLAVTDLCNPGAYAEKRDSEQAGRFLLSDALEPWAEWVGLDGQWIRETIARLAHPDVTRGLQPRQEAA